VPDASQLTASNCSGPSPNTPPRVLGNYFSIRPNASWVDSGDYAHTETLLLELRAPTNYGNAPTKIQFHSDLGPVHTVYGSQATADSIAQKHAAAIKQDTNSSGAVAGAVRDCTVGGQPAAAFGYSDGTNFGYRVFVVHKDLLFEIWLFGAGGVANQASQDALGMIGSLTWTP
jgi:predicted esterase